MRAGANEESAFDRDGGCVVSYGNGMRERGEVRYMASLTKLFFYSESIASDTCHFFQRFPQCSCHRRRSCFCSF